MTLSEHIAAEATKAYIARFENDFVNYVDQLALLVTVGDSVDARPAVQ